MNEQEKMKIQDDARLAGQLQALNWVLEILENAGKVEKDQVVNLKNLDKKCDEIREKIFGMI